MSHPESEARMVDVTGKDVSVREAIAACTVLMSSPTRSLVSERQLDKGDALEVARIAGIMAAKKTAELIPLCHPIGLGAVEVQLQENESGIEVRATVRTSERTGVEMEALTAVSVAALTLYDMVKGVERGVRITDVRLLHKAGGRSGEWNSPEGGR
ncbi:MAG: cyclic pyranopterin monophosphate synthase MoaC [Actinomycetota bacterium]